MLDDMDLALKIIMIIATSGAVYGAIRADIKNIHERMNSIAVDVTEANRRIDTILMKGRD